MSTYTGTARQVGKYWAVEVDGVGPTQARNLREVDDMAADLVASLLDVPVEDVQVDVAVELPQDVAADLAKVEQLHRVEADARAEAADLRRVAARKLAERGLPVRDVGKALGVSYQRAHQLVRGD
ncbi:hypothetical protein [Demetria terragena]|uniref:hypothetical protein n=1 Tax=Demetria terragena TaxID=63959 RepID=UPI00035D04DF|nr:hypothetical protein [Demetria terragena]